MRKIWWLPVVCVGACIVQALVAADSKNTSTRKNSADNRSRLLIYSRNQKDEVEEEPLTPRSRVESTETRPVTRTPTGDTGTISPKTALLPKTGRPSANSTASVAGKPKPAVVPVDDFEQSEDVRALFESETSPATDAGTAKVSLDSSKRRTGLPPLETTLPAKRSTDRYRSLLESVGNSKTPSVPVGQAKPRITPVSGEKEGEGFEINPFEPSENPTPVVNAGYEQKNGTEPSRKVSPASATSTLKITTKAGSNKGKSEVIGDLGPAKPSLPAAPASKSPPVEEHRISSSQTTHSPRVDVVWEALGEVTLGQECRCALIVSNGGKVDAREIIVEASLPESVRLVDSAPFPKESSSKLEWSIGSLAAGEKKTIELTIVPTKRGELEASAQVRFTGTAATSFQVSEPLLTTSVKLPDDIHLGDPVSASVTINNPGTGTAHNVVVETQLPKGLESTLGKSFKSEIGPLGPGESRTLRLALVGTAGGAQEVTIVARSSTADLEHVSSAKIQVLAPSLDLVATGPSLRYVNRAAKYLVTVRNGSNTASDNVRISQVVPKGFGYIKSDHGGQWESARRLVSWYIGHLEAGEAATVEVELLPQETGDHQLMFKVVGDSGTQDDVIVNTRVDAAASLVMEVRDQDDPIEVGTETSYQIRVKNEGSKSAQKVAISCELPPDVELVKADGPSSHLFESGMLIFKPLAELEAGADAVYSVHIKGTLAGTTKLRARLTSESIQKPLIVEEATQFYLE